MHHYSEPEGVAKEKEPYECHTMSGPTRKICHQISQNYSLSDTVLTDLKLGLVEDLSELPVVIEPAYQVRRILCYLLREVIFFEIISEG